MEPQDLDTCIRCGGYVETVNEQPGARCPHCGVRLDVTHSITFDEQEEAQALGCTVGVVDDGLEFGESAEIRDGSWVLVDEYGDEHAVTETLAHSLDRLLGFIYRTAIVATPEGRKF